MPSYLLFQFLNLFAILFSTAERFIHFVRRDVGILFIGARCVCPLFSYVLCIVANGYYTILLAL